MNTNMRNCLLMAADWADAFPTACNKLMGSELAEKCREAATEPVYTAQEVREWLMCWQLETAAGTPAGFLPLEQVIPLLECEQDGLYTVLVKEKQ